MNDNLITYSERAAMAEIRALDTRRETADKSFVDVTHWRGYRLPLRLELVFDDAGRAGDYHQVIDQDHRIVGIDADFEQSRRLVEQANASAAKRYSHGEVVRGGYLTVPKRLSWLHPCEGHRAIIGLAFECMVNRLHLGWIDNVTLFHLTGVGVLNADLTPKKVQVQRFHDWRVAENAALKRRGMQ